MKFIIEKRPFNAALQQLSRVVEKRNTYPILANVLIIAEQDQIRLRATDLDIEIATVVVAKVSKPGKITVEARLLSDIVRKFADGTEITFEVPDGKDAEGATIRAGRSRFQLATLSPDSFPDLKTGQFSWKFSVVGKDLLRIIDKVQFAISTEETRYYLNGIYLHATEDEQKKPILRGVATDGHRLARAEMELPDGANGMTGIIVPRKTVGEVAKLIAGAGQVDIEVSDTKIRFSVGDIVLLSKLIEGTFPDYNRVTPVLSNTVAEVSTKELIKAIDRVSTVATDRSGKAVKLTFADATVKLEVTNSDHGTSEEDLAATWDAAELSIGFNARYLQDVLENLSGANVKISLADSGSPTRIFSDDDRGTLIVLMPMRV